MNMKEFEYKFNLASTYTAKNIKEWCNILSDEKERPLKKENTISLYDFIVSFNNAYNDFKKDLSSLPQYHFGEKISLVCYDELPKDAEYKEFLMLYIDEPDNSLVDSENTFLQVWAKDNEYRSYVTNNINPLDKNSYYNKVNIDKNVLRKYLDFFKKYNSFIDTWKRISSSFIFSNGTSIMYLETENDIMKELNKITLIFGNYYMNYTEAFEIPVLLGDNITVDYNGSIIKHPEPEKSNKEEIINHLLRNIYLHRKDLSTSYENREECIFNSSENTINQNETNGHQRGLKK